MMNSPSMFSVEQLLRARQDGVPDYVVVPMLQKAMAQKQAVAQQQALQQGMNQPPPVAQQILGAAQNSVVQDHLARRAQEEQPEARGIDSLRSGIDESDYAGGGIVAFAEGGNTFEINPDDYAAPYSGEQLDPSARKAEYLSMMGADPNVAKQEARMAEREATLKSEDEKSPWYALMQAGLATMAGTSPNALTNIGEGLSKGLESYGESKKQMRERLDKLDEAKDRVAAAQRAEAVAAATYGMNSAEQREATNRRVAEQKNEAQLKTNIANQNAKLETQKLEEMSRHNKADEGLSAQRNAIARQSAAARGTGYSHEMTTNQLMGRVAESLKDLNRREAALLDITNPMSAEERKLIQSSINSQRAALNRVQVSALKGIRPDDDTINAAFTWSEPVAPVSQTPEESSKGLGDTIKGWLSPTPTPTTVAKPTSIGKTSVSNW